MKEGIYIKRPILIAIIGYIIGIIVGLYLKTSIVRFYIPIIATYLIIKKLIKNKPKKVSKLKLLSLKRYIRYLKIFINSKVILCIIFFSIISNSIVIFQNSKYDNLYKNIGNTSGEAIVVSNKTEKEYEDVYKIKIAQINNEAKYKNTYLYLKVPKKLQEELEYGDRIKFKGEFINPDVARNENGFNYKEYLKTKKIYGSIKTEEIDLINKNEGNILFVFFNKLSNKIGKNIEKIMDTTTSSLMKGILLGDKSKIEEDIEEDFRTVNLSHILAVSGMHTAYIILGVEMLCKKVAGKRKTRIITVVVLIFYLGITGFSSSLARAVIMGILSVGALLVYRKNDILTSIAISLFIILIYNPFLITDVGLQLSYLGTLGIILFHKNLYNFLRGVKIKNKRFKYRINRKLILLIDKIKEILSVTLAASIGILPVMLYHFNLFGTYFLIANLIVSIIIGPIVIVGTITVALSFISLPIAKFISYISKFLIWILLQILNLGNLPISKIYFPTPSIIIIVIYYIVIFIMNFIWKIYNDKNPSVTGVRVKNTVALLKYKIKQNISIFKRIIVVILIVIALSGLFKINNQKLEIHFLDVGQGDSTFIVTPNRKTILIDGGGSTSTEFDVGKSTVLPYILDKGFTKIDYVFVSHFDQDHIGRNLKYLRRNKSRKSSDN